MKTNKTDAMWAVIKHYGSQRNLAKALNLTEGAVSQWFIAGYLPPAQAIRIEKAMGGHVKAADLVKPD